MSEWAKTIAELHGEIDPPMDVRQEIVDSDFRVIREPSNGWLILIDQPDLVLTIGPDTSPDHPAAARFMLLYQRKEV